jgi:hypothetical protein
MYFNILAIFFISILFSQKFFVLSIVVLAIIGKRAPPREKMGR